MLNRRLLRIRVLKSAYAYQQSMQTDIIKGEKAMIRGVDRLFELYITLLGLVRDIKVFNQNVIDQNKKKHLPTQEDISPNTRFVDIEFVKSLEKNEDFKKNYSYFGVNWLEDDSLIRNINDKIQSLDEYNQLMDTDNEVSFEQEKVLWVKIVNDVFYESELLMSIIEERDCMWVDDFEVACWMLISTIEHWRKDSSPNHMLIRPIKDSKAGSKQDDLHYIKTIFRDSIINSEEYDKRTEEYSKNWDLDRIAIMDVLIIRIAQSELLKCKDIPVRVTLNEYIDLSKMFSTPKSHIFVNGVLDKMIKVFEKEGILNKSGRGLYDGNKK